MLLQIFPSSAFQGLPASPIFDLWPWSFGLEPLTLILWPWAFDLEPFPYKLTFKLYGYQYGPAKRHIKRILFYPGEEYSTVDGIRLIPIGTLHRGRWKKYSTILSAPIHNYGNVLAVIFFPYRTLSVEWIRFLAFFWTGFTGLMALVKYAALFFEV